MSQNAGVRIINLQLTQQIHQCTFLCPGSCVSRSSGFVQTTLITDGYTLIVPADGMSTHLMNRTTDVYLAITCNVEMITDTCKATLLM